MADLCLWRSTGRVRCGGSPEGDRSSVPGGRGARGPWAPRSGWRGRGRARQSLAVLGHPQIDAELSPTLASLRSYLRQISADDDDDVKRPPIDEIRTDSQAEARLLDAMRDAGFQPRGKLYVQGYELDFALQEHGLRLNVEVDGDHHVDARGKLRRQDLARFGRPGVRSASGATTLRVCFSCLMLPSTRVTADRVEVMRHVA